MIVMQRIEKKPLVFIGLDGMSWHLINFCKKLGFIPNLSNLLFKSSKFTLISTIPPTTPAAWTSILTGVNPGKHGITSFYVITQKNMLKLANAHDVKVPRLWEILSFYDYKIFVANIPLSTPWSKFNGIGIPDWLSLKPKFLIRKTSISHETMKLLMETQKSNVHLWHTYNKFSFADLLLETLNIRLDAYKSVIDETMPDALVFVISETDWFQHLFLKDLIKRRSFALFVLKKVMEIIDRFISHIIKTYKDAVFAIASDHGFRIYNKILSTSRFLTSARLWSWRLSGARPVAHLIMQWIKRISRTIVPFRNLGNQIEKLLRHSPRGKSDKGKLPLSIIRGSFGCLLHSSISYSSEVKQKYFLKRIITILRQKNKELGNPLAIIATKYQLYHGRALKQIPDVILFPDIHKGIWITGDFYRKGIIEKRLITDHSLYGIFAISTNLENINFKSKFIRTFDVVPLILNSLDLPIPSYTDSTLRSTLARKVGTRNYIIISRIAKISL